TILFDHHIGQLLQSLIGCEAPRALGALPPPADYFPLLALPRIYNLIVQGSAIRAFHGVSSDLLTINCGSFYERYHTSGRGRQAFSSAILLYYCGKFGNNTTTCGDTP